MPPKEYTNVIDGRTLYFEYENGELKPITVIFGFDLDKFAYKMLVRKHQNNYRRLHGLRPVRHKVWRHNPFAAKRMGKLFRRGEFKFK